MKIWGIIFLGQKILVWLYRRLGQSSEPFFTISRSPVPRAEVAPVSVATPLQVSLPLRPSPLDDQW